MYPEPVEGGKANRNRQRAVGAASLDAEGAGCATTLCPQHCRCPQHLREEEIPFLWPDGNSNENNAPFPKERGKKEQEEPGATFKKVRCFLPLFKWHHIKTAHKK